MSTYPLPTVAPTLSAAGISSPSLNDILSSFKASVQAIFGSDLYLDPDSQDGQELAIFAQAQFDSNMVAVAVYNSFNPQTAVGAALDSAVKLNGITRQASSASTCTVTLIGVAGTYIPAGVVSDVNQNLWNLEMNIFIPLTGTMDVQATCLTQGAIEAAPHTITTIFTNVVGWQTVDNAAAATPGAPVETDGALRMRQQQSTAMNALTTADALLARVLNLPGVQRANIYQNDTSTTDSNGIPAHFFSMVVEGGDPTQIAQTIALTKDTGSGTYGSTTVNVPDVNGNNMPIHFSELTLVPIYVNVVIHKLGNFSDASLQAIINNLVDFVNNLGIGEDVYYSWMVAAASMCDASRTSFVVMTLTQGISSGSLSASDITIAYNQAASLDPANVTVTLDNP